MSSPEYTAQLVIRIYPTGQPGKVFYQVTDAGPEHLSPQEAAIALHTCAELVSLGLANQAGAEPPESEPRSGGV